MDGLVPAGPVHPWKPQGDARFMPGGRLDGVESDFEHEAGSDGPDRPETLDRVGPDPAVELQQFLIGEARIGLADRYQFVLRLPDTESIVGIIGGALAGAALGIHQYAIDGERGTLPFIPVALGPSGQIGTVLALQHQPLDAVLAR